MSTSKVTPRSVEGILLAAQKNQLASSAEDMKEAGATLEAGRAKSERLRGKIEAHEGVIDAHERSIETIEEGDLVTDVLAFIGFDNKAERIGEQQAAMKMQEAEIEEIDVVLEDNRKDTSEAIEQMRETFETLEQSQSDFDSALEERDVLMSTLASGLRA